MIHRQGDLRVTFFGDRLAGISGTRLPDIFVKPKIAAYENTYVKKLNGECYQHSPYS